MSPSGQNTRTPSGSASRANASKCSVHGTGATLASIMISTSIPPKPKPLKTSLAISSAAPSLFEDSRTKSPNQKNAESGRKAELAVEILDGVCRGQLRSRSSISPNQKNNREIEKLSYSTHSSFCGEQPFGGSPATSDSLEAARMRTIPQPNQHSILYYGHYARRTRKHTRKNDLQPTTTSSTPPSAEPFVDDGPT